MTLKTIAHSRKVRLLTLSGHDNKAYQQMLVRYLHERFLYRLSRSRYREHFILKGGSLLFACDEFVPRPTLDIDFMGTRINRDSATIKSAFIQVMITPRPVDMNYPTIFDEEDGIDILAYSLETVVAEKFQTMIERSILNSRMKDFFDLHRILSAHKFDDDTLRDAINATFKNRHTEYSPSHLIFTDEFMNNAEMAQRWDNFLKKMSLESDMTFPEVVRFITTRLKPYLLLKEQ